MAARRGAPRGARSPRHQAYELQRLCEGVCQLHRWDREVRGHFPGGAAIVVANHQSYVDPVVLCAAYPCLPIAKSEVAHWPLLGRATRSLGVQFIQRGKASSGAGALRRVRQTLESGASVLNFPEGTTTRGGLGAFSCGIFGLARQVGVPVVPVFIRLHHSMPWVGDDAFVPHYGALLCRSLLFERCTIQLQVGPALDARQFAGARQLAERARGWISSRQSLSWA
jgi:lyso-ornithine lipid O-acyltransferase